MADAPECEVCPPGTEVTTYFCSACTTTFCDEHWSTQIQHRPGKTNLDGRPHIKENRVMIELMHSIFEPPGDATTLRALHAEDQDTRWFGVIKSEHGGASQFHDFRRYAQLMVDSSPLTGAPRYPKLISFIGDTSAGKSTIVKALVSHGSMKIGADSKKNLKCQTPVPGSTENETVATSEGVHLYADPAFIETERPILYADCEGLNAGERPPFATDVMSKGEGTAPRRLQERLHSRLQPRTRDLKWTKGGDPIRGTREYAVGHLYPRFLYTFSDAIVFVQKNPRQIHKTYKYLVDWAKFNVEESINQPILPHAIVVLNAVDMGHSDERWTVQDATNIFFRDVADAVASEPDLQKLAQMRDINPYHEGAARTLLELFYSEIHVIRIPAKRPDRYSLIDEQIRQLRLLIVDAGDKAHNAKIVKRRLNDVDTLQEYLQAGFDHFSANIDQPFDFKSVSLRTRVLAQDFGDHIISLASSVQEHTRIKGKMLFQGLVPLVASCILLDYVRNDLPGSVMEYFLSNYAPLCKAALYRFCDENVPCEFTSKKCPECKNFKSTHDKGHQNDKAKITSGHYVSSFEAKKYEVEWLDNIKFRLKKLEGDFDALRTRQLHRSDQVRLSKGVTDAKVAVKLHDEALAEFFSKSSSGQQCFSNATCFGCLMAIPEFPLPCGHSFCKSCITEHGDASSDLVVSVRCCPLHPDGDFEWEVQRRPEFAGVCILTLDGGGMRGIVELEVLKAIESRINVRPSPESFIPVQSFFDLIVGTSTGGIVALGLTVKSWRVDECISKFIGVCGEAFSPRELHGSKAEKAASLFHGSKWRTTPLLEALEEAFGNELIFGGQTSNREKYATKVAVVTTSQSNCRPLLVGNYNREEHNDTGHTLELSDDPSDVLQIWQAAAATSAAPSFFKPFECHGKTYLDGALNHNNPVYIAWREKKLIWPDSSRHPDILVSLGTGQHKADMDAKLKRDGSGRQKRSPVEKLPAMVPPPRKKFKLFSAWSGAKNYFSVLVNKLDNILDTERTWDDFYGDVVGEQWSGEDSPRYVRLNPDLRSPPPALDEKERLIELQSKVQSLLQSDVQLRRSVEDVANRLFASSFYFKKLGQGTTDKYVCSGAMCSKFEGKAGHMEQIGWFLKKQILRDFVPKVIVSRRLSRADTYNYDSSETYVIDMDEAFIDNMIVKKQFNLGRGFDIEISKRDEPTYICLQLRLDEARGKIVPRDYPISGFPRRLLVEKERNASRMQKHKADVERFRNLKRVSTPTTGEVASPTSPQGSRLMTFVRRAGNSSTEADSGTSSTPVTHDGLSDSEYDSEHELEKRMARLEMLEKDLLVEGS